MKLCVMFLDAIASREPTMLVSQSVSKSVSHHCWKTSSNLFKPVQTSSNLFKTGQTSIETCSNVLKHVHKGPTMLIMNMMNMTIGGLLKDY